MPTTEEIKQLFAEFPRDAVSWRAQSMTQAGDKAMALAYIDARDVMDRLDQICGPSDWQDRYEFHGARTICYLSIRVDGEWITKADGAGDSDVEAEKGAISDALKRAAVKWGIGRYLYSLDAPWVPCESYEKGGKKFWKRWAADPWSCIRGGKSAPVVTLSKTEARPEYSRLVEDMRRNKSKDDLRRWMSDGEVKALRLKLPKDWDDNLREEAAAYGRDLPDASPNLLLAG